MIRPLRCFSIGRNTARAQVNAARQVRRDNRIPIGQGHPQGQPVARNAGIVHQHVDAAKRIERRAHHRVDPDGVGHVHRDGDGPTSGAADLRGRRLSMLLARGGHDRGTGGAEASRNGATEAS